MEMSRLCCLRVGTFALALFGWSLPGLALDPGRRLTQYVHRIWQPEQGLPEVDLYSIGQTRAGYLWLGTFSGLVYFDGVRFTRVRSRSGVNIDGLWIRSVVEDSQGKLWLATDHSGLIALENGVATQYDEAAGMPPGPSYCVLAGRSGAWVCTRSGLARLEGNTVKIYGTRQGLPTAVVRAAVETPDGSLWVGSEGPYVSRWDGSQFRPIRLHSLPASVAVRAMVCSDDGAVWVGTINGLVRLKDGNERLFTVRDGLAGNYVICLAKGRDGTLWVGTLDGFSRLRNGEFESLGSREGLSQRIVHAVYEDREGSLWVGTKHGLNQFLDGRSVPYTTREGLPKGDMGPVLEDRWGNLWVGTLGGGIGRFDGRRFSVLGTRQGLVSDTIYSLAEDAAGDLWVATAEGVNRVHAGEVVRTYRTQQGLPANEVRCLFRDRSGILWAGTAAGPAKFERGRFLQPEPLRTLPMRIVAIGEDGRGRMFFAIERNRIYIYDAGRVSEISLGEGAALFAYAFYTDRDGLLWIGTMGGGLKLFQNERITSFRMRDGMYDTDIFGVVADAQDRLWLACSKGIFSVPRSSLLRFAAGEATRLESTPYTPIDLLRAIESRSGVSPAAWRATDGRLWFSTTQGALALNPQERKREIPPAPVLIERVIVNGKPDEPYQGGHFGPGRENLEFHYTALSFLEPNRTTFRYLLEGYDHGWIEAGTRRQAFYTNLPPGSYRFRVMACSGDGICSEAGNSRAFSLAPHFYARSWFLLLCTGLAALTAWTAYRRRNRRWREELALIVGERNRIARELHDTLIQGFSGITMQMQALAGRVRSREERATLEDIIVDASHCLRETRRSVEGLRQGSAGGDGPASAIRGFAQQIVEERAIKLRLKLDSSPCDLSAEAQYNLLRIAQEAITNAVRHSGARSIEVVLAYSRNGVRLSVKDDGSGISGEGDGGLPSGHYGLIGMRERATNLGANLQISSQPGKGTAVSVLIPLSGQKRNSPQEVPQAGELL